MIRVLREPGDAQRFRMQREQEHAVACVIFTRDELVALRRRIDEALEAEEPEAE